MSTKYFDIIIIGSGMSGLYSAYNIKNQIVLVKRRPTRVKIENNH